MFSRLSLKIKFISASVFCLLLVLVFNFSYYPNKLEEVSVTSYIEHSKGFSTSLSNSFAIALENGAFEGVEQIMAWAEEDSSLICIRLFDEYGELFVERYFDEEYSAKFSLDEFQESSVKSEHLFISSNEIVYGNNSYGRLNVYYSLDKLNAEVDEAKRISILVFALALGLSIGLMAFIAGLIVKPLEQLKNRLTNFDPTSTEITPMLVNSEDEIGQVTHTFNQLQEVLAISRKELVQSRDFYENIIDSMDNYLVVLDDQYRIKRVNKALYSRLGKTPEALLSNHLDILFDEKPLQDIEYLTDRYKGRSHFVALNMTIAKGETIPVDMVSSQLVEDGKTTGIFAWCPTSRTAKELMNKIDYDRLQNNLRLLKMSF